MEYIGRFISNFRELYNGINAATLTGAIDVVIVQQEDGTFLSSPFHVRFGKLGVLRSREKVVDIEINGDPVDIHMKLGESGEAFFVSEAAEGMTMPYHLATSPIPPSFAEEQGTKPTRIPATTQAGDTTLMGNRDDGILAADDDILLGSDPADRTSLFVAGSVAAKVECSFKPIDPDQESGGQAESLPESIPPPNMTEEERKRWKKRNRKRQKQLRRKQREANSKASSGSSPGESVLVDDGPDDGLLDEDSPTASEASGMTEQSKLGHRKSHSISGISTQRQAASDDAVNEWIQGGGMSRSIGPEFHFFSDTEMEIKSPDGSRPPSPFHSDTEFEVGPERSKNLQLESSGECPRQSWRWGELPSPPVPMSRTSPPKPASRPVSRDSSPSKTSTDGAAARSIMDPSAPLRTESRQAQTPEEKEAQRSMVSQMFSFMRQTKKMRNQAAGGGIYLDDLNAESLDPELAALYINQSSFRQAGLHHHPHDPSAPISTTHYATRLRDEDAESGRGLSLPQSPHSMSTVMRGSSSGPRSVDSDFEDSRHDYRLFPDVALSLCGNFADGQMDPPEELFLQSLVTYDDFVENPRLIENPDLLVRINHKYYTWQAACPLVMSWVLYQRLLPQPTVDAIVQEYGGKRDRKRKTAVTEQPQQEQVQQRSSSWFPWRRSQKTSSSTTASVTPADASDASKAEAAKPDAQAPRSHVVTIQEPVVGDQQPTTGTSSDNESNDSTTVADGSKKLPLERRSYYEHTDVFCKTLRLTTEQITQLHLREGPNEAVFSVTTAYQGTTRCKCHIYLWRYDDKVVISDIDGTITKSDVLGHILPIVGQDWAQSGVAQLFTKIKNNGYRILYLSARAIGQAHITREYLRSVRQGDLSLPDGPLLLNPTSLLSAFHREVIERKPEEFKISCLKDIQALFPSQSNPFYAGYGNRVNDVWAYRAVGIPTSRIFTINPRGELKLELTQSVQSSYSKQSFIVDLVFPPITLGGGQSDLLEGGDYNEFTYWRQPLPDLSDEADQFASAYMTETARKRRLTPAASVAVVEQK